MLYEIKERMFVTLTYHQFLSYLALIYLNPNEVMQLTLSVTDIV